MALSPFLSPFEENCIIDQSFGSGITAEDILVPAYNFSNPYYYRPWKISAQNAIKNFCSAISNEKDKFKICLDVQQFRPNEIMVKSTKTYVTVEAKHEERADEHGYITRQFTRKYKLPEECDSDTVTSNLTKDGVLIITAMKKYLNGTDSDERMIPIKMCEICPKIEFSKNKKEVFKDNLQQTYNSALKAMGTEENNDENKANMKDGLSCLLKDGSMKFSHQGNSDKFKNESKIESANEILKKSSEKFDASLLTAKSELSGFSSMSCETLQSKETTHSSTMSYDMKASSEKTSEYINEMIATELKQAAENV